MERRERVALSFMVPASAGEQVAEAVRDAIRDGEGADRYTVDGEIRQGLDYGEGPGVLVTVAAMVVFHGATGAVVLREPIQMAVDDVLGEGHSSE